MTNINASIIDQRLLGIQEEIREQAATDLGIKDSGRLKSLAFLNLCVKTLLDLMWKKPLTASQKVGAILALMRCI